MTRSCGEKGRAVDKGASDNGCAVDKGAVNQVAADNVRGLDMVAWVNVDKVVVDKGRGVDKVVGGRGVDKGASAHNLVAHMGTNQHGSEHEEQFQYNAEADCYVIKPSWTKNNGVYNLPGSLYRELLPHQIRGIEWLWGIHCQYPGAIVADDMGLGKTLQASMFLSGLYHSNMIKRVIIIAPLSVLDQWPEELEKADLKEKVHMYYKCDDTGLDAVWKNGGIVLTTYETYAKNYKKLMGSPEAHWDYIVLDEAHRIKNIKSATTRLVNKIHSRKKLLLTGTPMQKDLMDFYSLMNFIIPGILGDAATFHQKYVCSVSSVSQGKYANSEGDQKMKYLKALETALSRKLDKLCSCKITPSFVKSMMWQAVCNSPSLLLDILRNPEDGPYKTMARKLAYTFDAATLADQKNSSKAIFVVDLIKEILEEEKREKEKEMKTEGDTINKKDSKEDENSVTKILIFSRSIIMLDVIKKCLCSIIEEDQIIRIDGSVAKEKRKNLIERFKSKDGPRIFLLSSKVGGEGLNLTAATRLIIVDPSWNSSDDSQISDRVYRMGQKKDVYIYRLVTC